MKKANKVFYIQARSDKTGRYVKLVWAKTHGKVVHYEKRRR